MKVQIQEIEEFEVTDPQGLCNPPAPQLPSLPRGGNPMTPGPPSPLGPFQPQPAIPGGWGDPGIRPIPRTGDVIPPARHPFYTRHIYDPNDPLAPRTKWGVGGPMIQQQKDADDPEKILRGEDPDGK